MGTGFIVAEGYVMTCAHVVHGGRVIRIISTKGVVYNAKIETSDIANDWCLLSVEGLPGPPIPMATQTPNVGATIYCLGYPLGGITNSSDPIVGSGNIAALQRIDGDDRFLQITAPINPGNSGGPVLDQQGRWVGIVSQKLNDLRRLQESQTVAQGLNFAVKATFVKPLLDPRTGVEIAVAPALSRNEAISLEDITQKLTPSIVKIEVE
jgi:serine protease Do